MDERKKELTEQDAKKVTGGTNEQTAMNCTACRRVMLWDGTYDEGRAYDCPKCGSRGTVFKVQTL